MPVPKRLDKDMALLPVPQVPSASTETEDIRQPRRPTSLQGMIRFCMEATKVEDAPHDSEFAPMDEERKRFLENALKSLTVDVVEELQKQIAILKKVDDAKLDEDPTTYSDAIGKILEYIDQIDTANDFHKIGGFMILFPCLKSSHATVRAGGCELLAVLCQNNPYCQNIIIDNGFIPVLIKMAEDDGDINVSVKALYALGGITRDNREALEQLISHGGLKMLVNTLRRNNNRSIIKACFMLATFLHMLPQLKELITELGCVPVLINLLETEPSQINEHVLSLLVTLVEDNPKGLQQCKEANHNIKDFLQQYVSNVKRKEEFQEEEEYCKRLIHLLNAAEG